VKRRDTLKLLAAAGAGAATTGAACVQQPAPPQAVAAPGPARKATPSVKDPAAEVITGTTMLGYMWPTVDPFLFCVHHDDHYPAGNARFGPAASLAGREMGADFAGKDGWRMYHGEVVPGFPEHPHRGFETVTVVRRGLLDHSDSLGAAARYGGGDVQWLTAGRGIQHAEMFPLLDRKRENPVELFQIWMNLPSVNKMVDPHFSMLWRDKIPQLRFVDDDRRETHVTVVAGRYGAAKSRDDKQPMPAPPPSSWAAAEDNDVAIWTIKLSPGARWTLPAARTGTNRALYYFRGNALRVAGREIPSNHQITLRADFDVELTAGPDEAELLLLQGRPIAEPVVKYGPFVMNTEAEIQQAFADYQRTRFGGWPWKGSDPVHGAEGKRFAKLINGKTERPA
jgi:redox-sensitive bicupin YhaK (pirin superfamily)